MSKKCVVCGKGLLPGKYMILAGEKHVCFSCADSISRIQNLRSAHSFQSSDDISQAFENKKDFLCPTEIKQKLDDYVVGQDMAKKILSVAAYNHYKRVNMNDEVIKKSNVMLIGPTGCGKTYLVQTLAKILDVPLEIVAATNLTEAGYVGNDVESIIQRLLTRANGDVTKAERGIVFIDEVDKLVSGKGSKKEVGGKGVQQALLPILEGAKVDVISPKESLDSIKTGVPAKVTVDTSNILFICGGAFPDAEKIITNRLVGGSKTIGFSNKIVHTESIGEEQSVFRYITTDDLKEFGMIPEFLGRLPIIATLESLSVDTLKEILSTPKDSLVLQYQKLFSYDNVVLGFEDEALYKIAEQAYDIGTGARSLRSIMEKLLLELMYSVPADKTINSVLITRKFVEGKGSPVLNDSDS